MEMRGRDLRGSASPPGRLDGAASRDRITRIHHAARQGFSQFAGAVQGCLSRGRFDTAMKHRRLRLHDQDRAGRPARSVTASAPGSMPGVATGSPRRMGELADALEILARRMRAAVGERRTAARESEGYRRSGEMIAYLNSLYVRLQRRMEIPPEIWLLDGGGAALGGGRSRARRQQ